MELAWTSCSISLHLHSRAAGWGCRPHVWLLNGHSASQGTAGGHRGAEYENRGSGRMLRAPSTTNGRCPWGRASGETGRRGVTGRQVISRDSAASKGPAQWKDPQQPRAGACARRPAESWSLPSSALAQPRDFEKASAFLIWGKRARQTSAVKWAIRSPRGTGTFSWYVRTQGFINRRGTFWPDFAGRIYLLRSFGTVSAKMVSLDHLPWNHMECWLKKQIPKPIPIQAS